MKRLCSIFFLLLVLFNLIGYRLVINCMKDQQQSRIEARLDGHAYHDDELISIKTALHLPYYIGSGAYERAFGSINVNGVEYEYVKQRVYGDTLELLCLPNKEKSVLLSAEKELLQATLEGQPSQTNKKPAGLVKVTLPEFCEEIKAISTPIIVTSRSGYNIYNNQFSPADFTTRQERPPQFMLSRV